ncbi:MAG: hypothetical protein U0359_03530 [Byssovorax sp.]
MIERTHRFGRLVFDRDAIVRAALRTYIEAIFGNFPFRRLSFPACAGAVWEGDLRRGVISTGDGCGDDEVIAWTETGLVALGFQLGFGPIEHFDLPVSAVTGGPDDVRGAVPGLPDELEPALVMATRMLARGNHGERLAGVGFWLHGDQVAGALFDDPTLLGARNLAAWGLLTNGRLPSPISRSPHAPEKAVVAKYARQDAPIHALMDAVVDRRMNGPIELTTSELGMLFPTPPEPKDLLHAQRLLEKVGITWPGSPELPPEEPRPRGRDPFMPTPPAEPPHACPRRFGRILFDRDAIVRAALRAYVENIIAWLDPLERHPFAASFVPRWTGDLRRGAFSNGDGHGSYEVVAWTEAGVVGLAYELGSGPLEQLGLSLDAVTGGPDDVRAALPLFPAELEPALAMATGMLEIGAHGERLAGAGFWLYGEQVAGLHFHDPGLALKGARRVNTWGRLHEGRLRRWYHGMPVADLGPKKAAPIHALADAVTDRALAGPTELTPDEVATLLPTPPDPERLIAAQRMLAKVGITWPGSPELPPE